MESSEQTIGIIMVCDRDSGLWLIKLATTKPYYSDLYPSIIWATSKATYTLLERRITLNDSVLFNEEKVKGSVYIIICHKE